MSLSSGRAARAAVGLDRPHVFLPAETSTAGPALVLLHGTGGDEHSLLPLREHLTAGAAVLSVRGSVMENGMPRFFRRFAEGVFDEDDLRRRADDLTEFLAAAGVAYGFDLGSTVAVGFSNGANMAAALLLCHPGVLGGAVLFSVMVPFADPPEGDLAGVRVVVSNGERDPMIPGSLTQTLVGQLRDRRADVVELHHPGGHRLPVELLAEISRLI